MPADLMADQAPFTTEQLLTPDFWRQLAPALHIESPSIAPVSLHKPNLDADTAGGIQSLLRHEGYFQGHYPEWAAPFPLVTAAIGRLKALGLLPVFSLIYDEMWAFVHQLHPVIESALGPNYAILPDFWVWHVDPEKSESGWRPHRDKGFKALSPDGAPTSVTAWIPLTPATTLNGCMYIVPADRDPTYGTPQDNEWRFQYPDIRALPANPGDFFVWNQAVLHWGSHASTRAAGMPRMSCAFEFQRTDIAPWNNPLIQPQSAIAFVDRVRLIGKQVKQYQHMYPLPAHLSSLADRMIEFNP